MIFPVVLNATIRLLLISDENCGSNVLFGNSPQVVLGYEKEVTKCHKVFNTWQAVKKSNSMYSPWPTMS